MKQICGMTWEILVGDYHQVEQCIEIAGHSGPHKSARGYTYAALVVTDPYLPFTKQYKPPVTLAHVAVAKNEVKAALLKYQYDNGMLGVEDRDVAAEKLHDAYLLLCDADRIITKQASCE